MKILNRDPADNCFDGDFVVQYSFDGLWTRDSIKALEALGRLRYYESFPKPMFQLHCPGGVMIKGVQGTNECRVIFARHESDEAKGAVEKQLEDCLAMF